MRSTEELEVVRHHKRQKNPRASGDPLIQLQLSIGRINDTLPSDSKYYASKVMEPDQKTSPRSEPAQQCQHVLYNFFIKVFPLQVSIPCEVLDSPNSTHSINSQESQQPQTSQWTHIYYINLYIYTYIILYDHCPVEQGRCWVPQKHVPYVSYDCRSSVV